MYKLTNGKSFVTDPSNASRTMFMNLRELQWDQKMLNFFSVKENQLPQIQSSSNVEFGSIDFSSDSSPNLNKLNHIPITG